MLHARMHSAHCSQSPPGGRPIRSSMSCWVWGYVQQDTHLTSIMMCWWKRHMLLPLQSESSCKLPGFIVMSSFVHLKLLLRTIQRLVFAACCRYSHRRLACNWLCSTINSCLVCVVFLLPDTNISFCLWTTFGTNGKSRCWR